MKLWLHFHEQNLEVVDVQASCTISRPLYHHLLKMQSIQREIDDVTLQIKKIGAKPSLKKSLKDLKENYLKVEHRYTSELRQPNHAGRVTKISNLEKVPFVWVSFKSTEHAETALKVLKKDFEGQKIEIGKAVDPHQVRESKQKYWPEVVIAIILSAGIVVAAQVEIPYIVGELYVGIINILISGIFMTLKLIKRTTQSDKKTRHFTSSFLQYLNMCLLFLIMGQTQENRILYSLIMIPNPLAAMGVCISLSAGTPMMFLAGFVLMVGTYAVCKVMVLRYSFEPFSFFDESLWFLELCVIIHIIHSSYMLEFSIWPLIIVALLLIFLLSPTCSCSRKPQPSNQKSEYRKIIEQPSFSANFYADLSIDYLTKYSMRSQRELADIKSYFRITEYLPTEEINFQELCYVCNLTFEEVDIYIKLMEKRIGDIQDTINSHFYLLEPYILNDRKEKLKQQMVTQELQKEMKQKSKLVKSGK